MKKKLWCELKTLEEKILFLESGRAVETGIMASAIVNDFIILLLELQLYRDILTGEV